MIPALIVNPTQRTRPPAVHGAATRPAPRGIQRFRQESAEATRGDKTGFPAAASRNDSDDETRYLLRTLLTLFVAIVLPGLLGLLYLVFNPDAF